MTADDLRAKVVLLVVRAIVALTGLTLIGVFGLLWDVREVPDVLWALLGGLVGSLTTLLANSKGREPAPDAGPLTINVPPGGGEFA